MKKIKIIIESLVVLIGIIALLPQFHFIVTLFKSLAMQIGIGLAVVAIVFLLFKWKRTSFIAFMGAACFLFQTGFWNWHSIDSQSSETADLVVSHLNVLKFNHKHDDLIKSVKLSENESDIISFQEVDFSWNNDLVNAFQSEYPYIISHPREDCYGLLVMSKLPIQEHEIALVHNLPHIEATIMIKSKPTKMVFMHASTPMNSRRHEKRNEQILAVQEMKDQPEFVIGDFNSVPWDSYISDLKNELSISDSRSTYQGTYPSHLPFKIPIDYIFHGQEWECVSFEVMNRMTSDHLGIQGRYKLNQPQLAKKGLGR
jgi:endonuclease/exonuclease/phosphatase (EEP) superfamily protein YafD